MAETVRYDIWKSPMFHQNWVSQNQGYLKEAGTVETSRLGKYDLKYSISQTGETFTSLDGITRFGEKISKTTSTDANGIKNIIKTKFKTFLQNQNGELVSLTTEQRNIFGQIGLLNSNSNSNVFELIDGEKLVRLKETIEMTRKPGGQWLITDYQLGDFKFSQNEIIGLPKFKHLMDKRALNAISEYVSNLLKHLL